MPFQDLYLTLFEPLNTHRGIKGHNRDERKKIIERFITRWRKDVGPDIFPAFRLIMPDKDNDRPMYRLKEKRIATLLIKALGIAATSEDAKEILAWKIPGRFPSASAGDFAGRCYQAVKKREIPNRVPLTIEEVNTLLDQLARETFENKQLPLFRRFYQNMSADEMLWLIRIILRQMKIGATEKTILSIWHPDAEDRFNVTSSLKRVCWELHDKEKRMDDNDSNIELLQCFIPKFAQYQNASFQKMLDVMGCREKDPIFWSEEKLDGERMQMHVQYDPTVPGDLRFRFWSRRGHDYTRLYGENLKDPSALTCHLNGAFAEGYDNLIIDGEMITWDPKQEKVVPFGSLKTAANAEKENPGYNDGPQPLFRMFDIVYCNRNIAQYTLRDRRQVLETVIPKPVKGRLEIHPYSELRHTSEIETELRAVIASSGEGLVLKNPRSMYRPATRDGDWWKVKPDYMTEYGEDLDCVVIGAFFGSGRRGGIHSSYLCGLRVDGTSDPIRCWSFFKVGGGFSRSDYEQISERTAGKWDRWDSNRPPHQYIELGGSKGATETPDEWIKCEDSVVLAVKASPDVHTTRDYKTGFTLRFPRFKAFRHDKDPRESLTLKGFKELYANAEKQRNENKKMEAEQRRKRTTTRRSRKLQLELPGAGAVPAEPYAGATTEVFKGLTFYVMTDTAAPLRKTKAELIQLIRAHGGATRLNHDSLPGTICIADQETHYVKLRRADGLDLVRPRWLLDCVAQAQADQAAGLPPLRLPLEPRHLYHATAASAPWAEQNVDKYGDAYARQISTDELRTLISSMPIDSPETDAAAFREELARHGHDVSSTPRATMFQGLVLHFTGSTYTEVGESINLIVARSRAKFAGARLAPELSEEEGVTHVVVGLHPVADEHPEGWGYDKEKQEREMHEDLARLAIGGWRGKIPRVVNLEWVEACWEEETRLAEERYPVTPFF